MRSMSETPRALLAPLAALVLLTAVPACAQQEPAAAATPEAATADQSPNQVVGRVMGQEITLSELEELAGQPLDQVEAQLVQCQRQADTTRHQVLETALQAEINNRLLDAEAQKVGQTREQYVAAELESKIAPVTDEDVATFFEQNKDRIGNRTIEQVGPQIREYLQQQHRAEAERALFGRLEATYEVARLLEPPRTEVAATGPAKGPESAPITIVEFSDFECPFCSRVVPALDQVQANYGDKVRIVFRQFPLSIHPNAQKAAEASLCAAEQGKFWQMHDAMFAEQRQLAVENLKEKAQRLGLDGEEFNQCLDSGEFADEVAADLQAGMQAGVSGTPAMFINGIPISGAVPYEQIAQVIDAELERKGEQTN
jgi:protein-disulfide isomerase